MKRTENKYPAGTKVRLEDDLPDEAPHEVEGHVHMYGFDYLIFTDGYMAYVGRVVSKMNEIKDKQGEQEENTPEWQEELLRLFLGRSNV